MYKNINKTAKRLLCLLLCLLLTTGSLAFAEPDGTTYTELTYGTTDSSDVLRMQKRLHELGYMDNTNSGSYWASTSAAVAAFQQMAGLPVNKKVASVEMQQALFSSSAPRYGTTPDQTPVPVAKPTSPSSSQDLVYGTRDSDAVKQMQERLKELGYLSAAATGGYFDSTRKAVEDFQAAVGLIPNGKTASAALLALLYSSAAPAKNSSYVPTTAPVQSQSPAGTTYTELRSGMADNGDVRRMQVRLKELGYLSAPATGGYYEATKTAVADFQRAAGLTVNSKVASPEMQALLFSANAPVKGSTPETTPSPTSETSGYTELRNGMTGSDAVKRMQQRLKDLGYFESNVTGNYYAYTGEAVKAFQKATGLPVDADVASVEMQIVLFSSYAPAYSPASTPTPTSVPEGMIYTELRSGMTGSEDVRRMQQRLKDLGYMSVKPTGGYFSATRIAVEEFQKAAGLPVNEKVASAEMQTLLFSASAPAKGTTLQPTTAPTPTLPDTTPTIAPTPTSQSAYTELKRGMSGNEAVRRMQERLKYLGYMAGNATGGYYDTTASSVAAFQKKVGLPVDGSVASAEMQALLFDASAPTAYDADADYSELSYGQKNNSQVRMMQRRLKELGYLSADATGNYYGLTRTAVSDFLAAIGLAGDGKTASREMLEILYSSKAPVKGQPYLPSVTPVPSDAPATIEPTATPTPTPAPTPELFTIVPLKYGDKGSADVVRMQERLKELGYFRKSTSCTGNYYGETQTAVADFLSAIYQSGNGRQATVEMQEILYSDKAPVYGTHLATPAPSGDPQATPVAPTTFTELKYGQTKSDAVYALQARLKELGFMSCSPTGNFLSKTSDAIASFQKYAQIDVNSKVATVELQQLLFASDYNERIAELRKDVGDYSSADTDITLKKGDTSAQVKLLTTRLKELGYYDSSVTNTYSDAVTSAVQWFQNSNGLDADGVAGKETLKKLYSNNVISADAAMDSNDSDTPDKVSGTPPKPSISSVIKADFFKDTKYFDRSNGVFCDGATAIVTDVDTGISYRVKRVGGYNHCDVEPVTAYDTYRMFTIYDEAWSWTRHAVFVTLSNGTTLAGSINGMPHGNDHISGNNMTGHTCIHFLNSRTHGTDKVDTAHQDAVKKAASASVSSVQSKINNQK